MSWIKSHSINHNKKCKNKNYQLQKAETNGFLEKRVVFTFECINCGSRYRNITRIGFLESYIYEKYKEVWVND